MANPANEDAILLAFKDNCIGKSECSLPFDYATMFDAECNQEIASRRGGDKTNGPPKIFGLVSCEKDGVDLLGNKLTRS